VALHKYLTFSFVPGEDVPVLGVRRLLPGRLAEWDGRALAVTPYFTLREAIDPELADRGAAVRAIRRAWRQAVTRRLNGEHDVGLYLSGGIDSSGVAVWLRKAGVGVRAFSLDFGAKSVEKPQARIVAEHLGLPLTFVKAGGEDVAPVLLDLVWKLDLPFGDAVTGPQYLLGRTAHEAGLSAVFNGEGGDQFFGGWTSKPMIAAELYAGLYEDESREARYLRSYHRFYGREEQLLADYSFDRAVICDRARTADLLIANNVHFENNCAVLSVGGYPPGPFETIRAMLRKNPRLQVFALHDATGPGCRLAHQLATSPEWFKDLATVTDVGLRPSHAKPFRGLLLRNLGGPVAAGNGITAKEAEWLARHALELAAIRPEQLLKRLFRAINRKPGAQEDGDGSSSSSSSSSDSDGVDYDTESFSADAGDSDGGADAFG
jgi:hypothetical protein